MDESLDFPPSLLARLDHVPLGALDFDPVPVKSRRNGWSPRVQKMFVAVLAAGLGMSGAARAVGRSRQTAYRLRQRPGAASFAAAWDRALEFARRRPPPPGTTAWERAIEGVLVPVRNRGGIVGWRRKYCNRTLASMLTSYYRLRESEG